MANKEQVVQDFIAILGQEKVISDRDAIIAADAILVRNYEKAFNYVPEHVAMCTVKVASTEDVVAVMQYCNKHGIHVIARTGASSSEDQLLVTDDNTIFVDGAPMNQIVKIDPVNMVATAQCGVPLAVLEAKVNELGLTTGHCPQSQPMAYMGGLVATRSIGQFSTYYGGIEDLVCGMEVVLPDGDVTRIRPVPRRAAGPDLRHLFIGGEGIMGFMTEVTVKLFTYYPDEMWKGGYIVKNFHVGLDVVREIMVKGYKPSVVRLYDKPDVDHNYGSVQLKDEEAFMFFSVEGPGEITKAHGEAIHRIAMEHGAEYIGTKAVDHWFLTRNNLCNVIGTKAQHEQFAQTHIYYATVEICADWSDINKIYDDVMAELPEKLPNLTMLGGHVSHSYMNGTNIYFVYNIRIDNPETASAEQYAVVDAICDVVLRYQSGTVAHHHGIGKVRSKRIKEELGSSYELLTRMHDALDPNGIMNPGCLIPLD